MPLKSEKSRREREKKKTKQTKNMGGGGVIKGFLWPVVVYYMCEWSDSGLGFMRVCGYGAFSVSGLSVSYFHI